MQTSNTTPTILVIDDNEDFRQGIVDILLDAGFDVRDAGCPDEAFKLLRHENVDVLLCDLDMPFRRDEKITEFRFDPGVGVKTIHELQWVFPTMPIVAMSALPKSALSPLRKELAPIPLVQKPFSSGDLLELIRGISSKPVETTLH